MKKDLTISRDEKDNAYFTCPEGNMKTRQSGVPEKHRTLSKILETNLDRCHIRLFKFYVSKDPLTTKFAEQWPLFISYCQSDKQLMKISAVNNLIRRVVAKSPL